MRKRSSGVDRILFTADQQFQLEALFQKKKFPVRKEKALLAAKLGVPLEKVTVCSELLLAFDSMIVILKFTNDLSDLNDGIM